MSEDVSDIDEAEYEKFVAQKQADRAQRGMRRAQNGDDNFSDSDNSDYWKEKPGALPKVNDVVGDGSWRPENMAHTLWVPKLSPKLLMTK